MSAPLNEVVRNTIVGSVVQNID